ncbi:MAG: lipase secretion chaperone [Pseudomonadota bacterium]
MPRNTQHPLKRTLLPLALVLPMVAAGVWLLQAERPTGTAASHIAETQPTRNTDRPVSRVAVPPASANDRNAITHSTPRSLGENPYAPSLAGTEIDGRLRADADGNLVIELETRDFFDYFLNTIGEVPAERALTEIEALAYGNLPETAARQAMALLDRYLQYKDNMMALGNRNLDPTRQHDPAYQLETLKTALADLKALRRQSFSGHTHEAFFGLEEAYGDYTLASLDIQQRQDLSAEARADLQAWHRQQLPEVIRRTETRMMAEGERHQQRQDAITRARSAEEAGERLRTLGVDEARVTEVVGYLQERERFDEQFQTFQQDLASLDTAGLADDDAAAMEAQLLRKHFADEKTRTWARLRALEVRSP